MPTMYYKDFSAYQWFPLVGLFIVSYFCGFIITQNTTDIIIDETYEGICKHPPAEMGNETRRSNCTKIESRIVCFGDKWNISKGDENRTKELILCNLSKPFDPSKLKIFINLTALRIEHSNFTHISKDFPNSLAKLERINISWTNMGFTRPTLFMNLKNVKSVDLRWNKLDHMESIPKFTTDTFQSLYLDGNPWNCSRNLKWILNGTETKKIADVNDLKCRDLRYLGRPILIVMEFQKSLREACSVPELKNCSCSVSYVGRMDGSHTMNYISMNSVNCSNLNLNSLPPILPPNTTTLYVTHNKIVDLDMLNNINYQKVYDVYLDFNKIKSADSMENGNWLRHFRVFSLKGNQLTRFPVYAFDNFLEKNHHMLHFYLSQNPWRCDCHFTPKFQEFLMKYSKVISDSGNVTCKYVEGDQNFRSQVLSLRRGDVCKLPTEHKIQPLDLLNGILGTLIILVLGKLAYDYYRYRKYGALPWIVTKIP